MAFSSYQQSETKVNSCSLSTALFYWKISLTNERSVARKGI